MKLSKIEQETNILFNEKDTFAVIEVCQSKMKRKLARLLIERPEDIKLIRRNEYADTYKIPKSWIKISPKRILSEAQMEQLVKMRSKLKKFIGRGEDLTIQFIYLMIYS